MTRFDDNELRENGFDAQQIEFLHAAELLVDNKLADSVEDLNDALGYGIIDAAILRDSFFDEPAPSERDLRIGRIIRQDLDVGRDDPDHLIILLEQFYASFNDEQLQAVEDSYNAIDDSDEA